MRDNDGKVPARKRGQPRSPEEERLKLHPEGRKEPVRGFKSEKGIQMANKHMNQCSPPLVIRGMHTETTVKYHFIPTRMANIFFFFWKRKTSVGGDMERLEPSYVVVRI